MLKAFGVFLILAILISSGRNYTVLMLKNLAAIAITDGAASGNEELVLEGYTLAMRSTELMDGRDSGRKLAGYARLKLGQPAEAITVLAPLEGADYPDRLRAYWLGIAYEQAGNRDDATRTWIAAGRTDKVVELAINLAQTGDLAGAQKEYDRILSITPDLLIALAGEGEIALAREDWRSVASLFEKVLLQNPNDPQALVGLGMATWHLDKDAGRSARLIEKAIANNPKCTWCYLNLAEIESESGHPEAAIAASLEAERLAKINALAGAR